MSVWVDTEAMNGVPQVDIERKPDDATTKYKVKRKGKKPQFLTFDKLQVAEKVQYGLAKTIDRYDFKKYQEEGWIKRRLYNTSGDPQTPKNIKEVPCDTCPMKVACAAEWNPSEAINCQAYRDWIGRGDYNPNQIQEKLKRAA